MADDFTYISAKRRSISTILVLLEGHDLGLSSKHNITKFEYRFADISAKSSAISIREFPIKAYILAKGCSIMVTLGVLEGYDSGLSSKTKGAKIEARFTKI